MKSEEYSSSDIWLVAVLMTYGVLHERLDQANPTKQTFVYLRTPELDKVVASHYSGQLNVPSLLLKNNYAEILDMVKTKMK